MGFANNPAKVGRVSLVLREQSDLYDGYVVHRCSFASLNGSWYVEYSQLDAVTYAVVM